MRYVIRVDSDQRLESTSNLKKYEVISIVIKRILGLLQNGIKNLELVEDDTNLLVHLVAMCH